MLSFNLVRQNGKSETTIYGLGKMGFDFIQRKKSSVVLQEYC